MTTDRSRLQQLRRIAKRHDMAIRKSRVRYWHGDDFGGYRIIDITNNALVRGAKFELTLKDVADYFQVVALNIEAQEWDSVQEIADMLLELVDLYEKERSEADEARIKQLIKRAAKLKKEYQSPPKPGKRLKLVG